MCIRDRTYADLPALGPGDAGTGYFVQADGKLYVWDGAAFPADGAGIEFRGPEGPAGPEGPEGPAGPKGDPGDTGPAGADGLAATVEVGTVTTGAPGTDAAVENVGTPTAAVLNFTIPRGNPGSGGGGDASFPAVMARVSMGF